MYRHSPPRRGGYTSHRARGRGSPYRRETSPQRFQESDRYYHSSARPAEVSGHHDAPAPHIGYHHGEAPQLSHGNSRSEGFQLLLKRADIATRVVRELSRQLALSTLSPAPQAAQGVTKMAGSKLQIDPSARFCPLCEIPYNVQIARQHFEGKRHRQHLLRLVHLQEFNRLEEQALLARQAGCTLTEELYGPYAHQPIVRPHPTQATSSKSSVPPKLSVPDALRREVESHSDSDVGGLLMQELIGLLDSVGDRTPSMGANQSSHSDRQDRPIGHGSRPPKGDGCGFRDERSYFHSAGEQLRGAQQY